MQTFLPYASFYQSLCCLDNKRLGKQRVEAMQLVRATEKLIADPYIKMGWINIQLEKCGIII